MNNRPAALCYEGSQSRGLAWRDFFREHAPDIEFRLSPDKGNPDAVRYLATWEPVPNMEKRFPNLQVLFSTGAGVDQFDLSEIPGNIQLVRLIDPAIVAGMREYVCFAVLALHRSMIDYRAFQTMNQWQPLPTKAAADVCVGVMGIGSLGQAALDVLRQFGYSLRAWSRTAHDVDNVACFAGKSQLGDFVRGCNILVCLLPLTPETKGILNRDLFDAMPRASSLINIGRGGHLREDDLLSAVEDGRLSGAVLDVVNEEPPGADHPFWEHPRIWLTPHIASMTGFDSAARVLLDNIQRHQRAERMVGVIDRTLGY